MPGISEHVPAWTNWLGTENCLALEIGSLRQSKTMILLFFLAQGD